LNIICGGGEYSAGNESENFQTREVKPKRGQLKVTSQNRVSKQA